jgi:hypothetical protein
MTTKIIEFPYEFLKRKNQPSLTPLMIDTLLAACQKQKEKIPYGPVDIKRSFMALINRGLIVRRPADTNEDMEQLWQVTAEAISMLRIKGIDVTC